MQCKEKVKKLERSQLLNLECRYSADTDLVRPQTMREKRECIPDGRAYERTWGIGNPTCTYYF